MTLHKRRLRSFFEQDVFSAEELRLSVTSGQYRRQEQSLAAVVMKNAAFQWPFASNCAANADRVEKASTSKPWQRLRKRDRTGKLCFYSKAERPT